MISALAVSALADEISSVYATRGLMATPSSLDRDFDLDAAYAVEAELTRRRRADGWKIVGRKVGYANKALWRALKLETLVWASMYDRTVEYAKGGHAFLHVGRMVSPKIEPEIVVKLNKSIESVDAAGVLASVEWLAVGFEIIDCVFHDWKFQPADFVAAFGLHAALVVGEPVVIGQSAIASLVEQLPELKVRLLKSGELVDEGSGRNALRSPALCVGELAAALRRQKGAEPLTAGELVSTGTLTAGHPVSSGEHWKVELQGVDLPDLTLDVVW